MHADIRIELQLQAASSMSAQQRACDDWRAEFNHVRPHEALGMRRRRRYIGRVNVG
jgi:hypothetical protein